MNLFSYRLLQVALKEKRLPSIVGRDSVGVLTRERISPQEKACLSRRQRRRPSPQDAAAGPSRASRCWWLLASPAHECPPAAHHGVTPGASCVAWGAVLRPGARACEPGASGREARVSECRGGRSGPLSECRARSSSQLYAAGVPQGQRGRPERLWAVLGVWAREGRGGEGAVMMVVCDG